jgi:hypothetical protein
MQRSAQRHKRCTQPIMYVHRPAHRHSESDDASAHGWEDQPITVRRCWRFSSLLLVARMAVWHLETYYQYLRVPLSRGLTVEAWS